MNARDAFMIGDLPTLMREMEGAGDARMQVREEMVTEQLAGIGEDLRSDAIRHHEDCLFRAIRDMQRCREAVSRDEARWRESPGARGAFRSGHALTYPWAYANALKHERELREIPDYVMPAYLRQALKDAMGCQ